MTYDKENLIATFAEDATLNTFTYHADDSCLATWREYLDLRQQYDCARKVCQSINECLESGGGAISPDPKACIQAANEIRILYCTMGLM